MEHLNKTQLDDPNIVYIRRRGKQTLKIANILRTFGMFL